MMWLLVGTAAAQVVNGDFETGTLSGWIDRSWEDPSQAIPTIEVDLLAIRSAGDVRGSHAGFVYRYAMYMGLMDIATEPFTVTHTELSYARIDLTGADLPLVVDTEAGDFSAHVPGPASTDAFTNWVVPLSAEACAGEAQLEIREWLDFYSPPYDDWRVDDFVLSGPICAEYLDADGDGVCPLGTDLDGNGDCVGDGEISDVDVDCDDSQAAIADCLEILEAPRWWDLGRPFKVVVAGANPLETVHLVSSQTLGQTCPPRLGGHCLQVATPLVRAGTVQADGSGVALFEVDAPPGLDDWGHTVHFEALVDRGPASISSDVATTMTRPASGPPASPGFVNGDLEAGSVGWSEIASTWWTPYEQFACPDGLDLVATSRGTSLGFEITTNTTWCDYTDRSWPSVVTHEVLAHARKDASAGTVRIVDAATGTRLGADEINQVVADGWTEALEDLSAWCGEVVWMELGGYEGAQLDDVAWTGPVCPQFEDLDGDGLCDLGVDLDGDGTCVDAGEHGPEAPVIEPLAAVLQDFEDGTPGGWDGTVVAWDEVEAPWNSGWGTHGLLVDWGSTWPVDWSGLGRIVTHETLAFSHMFAGVGDYTYQGVGLELATTSGYASGGTFGPLVSPATWVQQTADLAGVCGQEMFYMTLTEYDQYGLIDDGTGDLVAGDLWYIDDLGFVGPACAIFTDYDGDGSCSEGLDLDGNGTCVGDGEPTPGTVQDANEPLP